jgi:hypothetical protein
MGGLWNAVLVKQRSVSNFELVSAASGFKGRGFKGFGFKGHGDCQNIVWHKLRVS